MARFSGNRIHSQLEILTQETAASNNADMHQMPPIAILIHFG
jgi:hypothetical protein